LVSLFAWNLSLPVYVSHIAGMTGMYHHALLID
jgi:hypothetical protein